MAALSAAVQGAVTRGPGSAELTLGAESQGATHALPPERLPQATRLDADHTQLVGLGAAAPEVDAQGGAAGMAGVEASLGEAAWSRRLSPQHRKAVGSFFGAER